jgi:hypothetical protein
MTSNRAVGADGNAVPLDMDITDMVSMVVGSVVPLDAVVGSVVPLVGVPLVLALVSSG